MAHLLFQDVSFIFKEDESFENNDITSNSQLLHNYLIKQFKNAKNNKLFQKLYSENFNLIYTLKNSNFTTPYDVKTNYKFIFIASKNLNRLLNVDILKQLNKLKYLKLETTTAQITDSSLQNLINLEELYCNNSSIHDDRLINLKNLTTLNIMNNPSINGSCFNYLNNLTFLTMTGTYININYLKYLQNLKNLTLFNAEKSFTFQYFKSLENLYLFSCNTKDEDLNNLNSLKRLRLDFCNEIAGNCFIYLNNLEYLKVDSCKINENNLQYLLNLRTLIIKDQYVCGKYFMCLKNLKKLKFNKINNFVEDYIYVLTNLENLNVENISIFTGRYLNKFVNLTKLNVSSTNINDEHLFKNIKLKKLNISNCKVISGKCFKYLQSLQILNLKGTRLLTTEYLNNLINLKELNIKKTNISKAEFLLNLSKLQILKIDGSFIDFFYNEIKELQFYIERGFLLGESIKFIVHKKSKESMLREDIIYNLKKEENDL
ncbi:hypothetical protein ABK040_006972 [Willaertia magna]